MPAGPPRSEVGAIHRTSLRYWRPYVHAFLAHILLVPERPSQPRSCLLEISGVVGKPLDLSLRNPSSSLRFLGGWSRRCTRRGDIGQNETEGSVVSIPAHRRSPEFCHWEHHEVEAGDDAWELAEDDCNSQTRQALIISHKSGYWRNKKGKYLLVAFSFGPAAGLFMGISPSFRQEPIPLPAMPAEYNSRRRQVKYGYACADSKMITIKSCVQRKTCGNSWHIRSGSRSWSGVLTHFFQVLVEACSHDLYL